jgi:hypothetical protein
MGSGCGSKFKGTNFQQRHLLAVYDKHFLANRIFMAFVVGNPVGAPPEPYRLVVRLP